MIAVAAYAAQHKRALFHGLTPTATCCRGYAALREHWRKWPFLGRGIPTWLHRSPQVPRKERNKIQTSALQLPETRNVESATILIIYPPGHQPGDSVGAAKAVAACSRGRQPMERGGDVGELSRERGGSKQRQTKLKRKPVTHLQKRHMSQLPLQPRIRRQHVAVGVSPWNVDVTYRSRAAGGTGFHLHQGNP